jgi:hypothetical protein
MEETTLDAGRRRRIAIGGGGDRLAAWLYTGAPGRAASFSIDLVLSFAALGVWTARRLARALRSTP